MGAKALTLKQAIIVASFCEFLGAVLLVSLAPRYASLIPPSHLELPLGADMLLSFRLTYCNCTYFGQSGQHSCSKIH